MKELYMDDNIKKEYIHYKVSVAIFESGTNKKGEKWSENTILKKFNPLNDKVLEDIRELPDLKANFRSIIEYSENTPRTFLQRQLVAKSHIISFAAGRSERRSWLESVQEYLEDEDYWDNFYREKYNIELYNYNLEEDNDIYDASSLREYNEIIPEIDGL
tara:strand:+ start:1365 stop:1844 length:480 start_codon:yes stop_codon:yes gene_type:complete